MEHCYVILSEAQHLYLPMRRLAPSLNRSTVHFLDARSGGPKSQLRRNFSGCARINNNNNNR